MTIHETIGFLVVVRRGGTIGNNLESFGATVEIAGGIVGNQFDAYDDTTVNISGGELGTGFTVHDATVNISGGKVGSLRNLAGDVHISGGVIAGGFTSFRRVDLYGAEFYLNGRPVSNFG